MTVRRLSAKAACAQGHPYHTLDGMFLAEFDPMLGREELKSEEVE